jgi:hypothetical protein
VTNFLLWDELMGEFSDVGAESALSKADDVDEWSAVLDGPSTTDLDEALTRALEKFAPVLEKTLVELGGDPDDVAASVEEIIQA